jgi:hypothetical protein
LRSLPRRLSGAGMLQKRCAADRPCQGRRPLRVPFCALSHGRLSAHHFFPADVGAAIAANIERLSRRPPTGEAPSPRPPTGEAPSPRPPTAFQNFLDQHAIPGRGLGGPPETEQTTKIPDRVKLTISARASTPYTAPAGRGCQGQRAACWRQGRRGFPCAGAWRSRCAGDGSAGTGLVVRTPLQGFHAAPYNRATDHFR